MVENNSTELTDAEAEQYDRQIRLWGLDSQKRLRASRVLVIGMTGLGAEVVKNIVLAGVKSVTLLDPATLTKEEACSQFLAPKDKIGENRAEASLDRTRNLNPMVTVVADKDSVDSKPDEFFFNFDVMCATQCSQSQLVRLDCICRNRGIKFFCGDVYGFFGYHFADLQQHEYAEDIVQNKAITLQGGHGEPSAKAARTEPVKTTVKRTTNFVPLEDALDVDWTSDTYKSRLTKADPSYFLLKVLLKFRSKHNRDPMPSSRESDYEELLKTRDEELAALSVPDSKIPDDLLGLVFAEVSPVCAIVGGVLTQEIIKAISLKEAPHNNMFFFNPERNLGLVECVGS